METSTLFILQIPTFAHQRTVGNRTERASHNVIHLDSVIESAEMPNDQFADFVPKHQAVFEVADDGSPEASFILPVNGVIATEPYANLQLPDAYQPPSVVDRRYAQSANRDYHDANESDNGGFYGMLLDVLETFRSAAEHDVRRSRKRESHRSGGVNVDFYN